MLYCNSLTQYSRLKTKEVKVGDYPMGGNNPIRVQSMTTTDTMDTLATVEQSVRMIEKGCEYVRITAPSIKEAQNLLNIKNELRRRGYDTPLIADIHFTPNAAEVAARIVEKVRINPGNFADKKKFETIDYTDSQYIEELERIRSRFIPLIKICKEYGTAMRIGTNHGSLSDRIMSRYGDTPLGMVESAMEFLRICESEGFKSIVLSMKSSNPQVMVQAYRLLIATMHKENMHYPLHLGVTEAGDGEDGRIKSAAGIGTLLQDGIGDTIRVSLTEDPEHEIPVARSVIQHCIPISHKPIPEIRTELPYSPFIYNKRKTKPVHNIGGLQVPRVIANLSGNGSMNPEGLIPVGYRYDAATDKWNISDQAADYIYMDGNEIDFPLPGTLGVIYNYKTWLRCKEKFSCFPFISFSELDEISTTSEILNFIGINDSDIYNKEIAKALTSVSNAVLVFQTENEHTAASFRRMFIETCSLMELNDIPVIIKKEYNTVEAADIVIKSAAQSGSLFLDGFGDGLWLSANNSPAGFINRLSFGILQACRQRISKTEYISCPSCGRTLFDLQTTTARIRMRTSHLKGVKIAVMGCIVNGPGEMADADYGYVGSGPGKITLYKGKEVMQRNIASEEAVDALIELIRKYGDWIEENQLELNE